jgi:hypothetical protein
MKTKLFQMDYYDTYYFANIIHTVITNSFPYLRTLDSFFGDLNYKRFLANFPKHSALHQFIEFGIDQIIIESIDDVEVDAVVNVERHELWISHALRYHQIEHIGFTDWLKSQGNTLEDVSEEAILEYYQHLYDAGPLEDLQTRIVDEVFFLLFLNRDLLRQFNEMISFYILNLDSNLLTTEEKALFRRNGTLKRAYIPAWARRAVFYRDRGRCAFCYKDISGLVSIQSQQHYDHIVPLAKGGINDVTNLQLLCNKCNLQKKDINTNTSKFYERWYS